MAFSFKPSQRRKTIAQVVILSCASILLIVHLISPIRVYPRQARQQNNARKAQIVVTRSYAEPRSDVWLSVLQALSKARHLQTFILDDDSSPLPLPLDPDSPITTGRDASLENLAKALEWKQAPHINKMNLTSSTDAIVETLGTKIDVIMTTSCASDLLERPIIYHQLLERTTAILFCMVDDVEPFISTKSGLTPTLQSWADELRLQFITLSDDVAHILRHEWAAKAPLVTARVFPPIYDIPNVTFPYDETRLNHDNASIAIMQEQETISTLSASSLGLNDAMDRFVAARSLARKNKARTGNALILGKSEILDTIQNPVGLLDKNLEKVSSRDAITTIRAITSSTSIVVVANDYNAGKTARGSASSSIVPLAIIAGVPPIVDEETFASHSYLDQDAAIVFASDNIKHLQEKVTADTTAAAAGKTMTERMDMIKAFDYLAIPDFQQARKRRAVETLRTTLLVQNTHKLQAWILQDTRRAAVSFKVQL